MHNQKPDPVGGEANLRYYQRRVLPADDDGDCVARHGFMPGFKREELTTAPIFAVFSWAAKPNHNKRLRRSS